MSLDLKTLFMCNFLIVSCIAIAHLFYKANHKTYPGYGYWIAATFFVAAAFLSLLFRPYVPEIIGILLLNGLFAYSSILRLEGAFRFTSGRILSKAWYVLPVVLFPGLLYYYYVEDILMWRNMISAMFTLLLTTVTAVVFISNKNSKNKILYNATAMLYALSGMVIFARALLWITYPNGNLYDASTTHQIYFLLGTIFEVVLGINFLMMNNQRLEIELVTVQRELQAALADLEKSVSEVKILSGIIPICMHCKEIRDDQGYWKQLEEFITKNSEAQFSHGICPKCMQEKYSHLKVAQNKKPVQSS